MQSPGILEWVTRPCPRSTTSSVSTPRVFIAATVASRSSRVDGDIVCAAGHLIGLIGGVTAQVGFGHSQSPPTKSPSTRVAKSAGGLEGGSSPNSGPQLIARATRRVTVERTTQDFTAGHRKAPDLMRVRSARHDLTRGPVGFRVAHMTTVSGVNRTSGTPVSPSISSRNRGSHRCSSGPKYFRKIARTMAGSNASTSARPRRPTC